MAAQVRKNGDMRAFGGCQARSISGILRGVMSFGWCHMLIPSPGVECGAYRLSLVWCLMLIICPGVEC
eukprot:1268409-Pleurochrysis_carterae.AAC.2